MQEGTRDALEAGAFLPEATCDVGDVVGELTVSPPTVPLQEETTWLLVIT